MTLLNQITYYISRLAAFRISKRGLALTGLIVVMGMYAHSSDAATISRPMQSLGLVGYWSFDVGKGGAKAVDMSGRGNNGTLTNMNTTAAWVGGKIGQALNFDGSNDFVNAGSATILDDMGPLTWSAWIYPRGFGEANEAYIIGKGTNASFGANYTVFHLIPGDSYSFEFLVHYKFDTFSIPILRRSAANAITLNKWQYVAVTWDGSTDSTQIKLFVNGAETSYSISQTPIGSRQSDAAKNVLIGNDSTSGDRTFDGLIDEVRIYNRALSATEIKRLYRQTSPQMNASQANKLRQGLVGMWTFDGNDMSGNTAIDRSGNGNNGTLTNGPKKAIGKIGQALNFDGSDDLVNAGSAESLDNLQFLTVGAWIYTRTISACGGDTLIVDKGSVAASGWHFALPCNLTKALRFRVNQVTTNVTRVTSNNTVKLNQWQHVAVTFASSTQTIVAQDIHIYVDGVETTYQTNTDGSGARDDDSAQSVRIGSSSSGNFFDGLIDEVRVYNRALTEAEIRQLYKAGSSFHPNVTNKSTIRDGLVGHWTFDGADMGTTSARDASGNANTGWLINGTKKAIGKIGQALNFDGVDDYVDASTANVPLPATMSLFFYIDKNPTSDQALFSHNSGSNNGYRMGLNSTDATTFTLGGVVDYPFTNLVTSGAGWYFFAITVTGNSGTATGYFTKVGGALVTQSNAIGNPSGTPNRFTIGRRGDNVTFFPGLIDEVRVYNRALSPDEVKRLYNMGR